MTSTVAPSAQVDATSWSLDWAEELAEGAVPLCLRNFTIVVMAGSASIARLKALRTSWANPIIDLLPGRLFIMSDRAHRLTGERTTPALSGRTTKRDAPSRLVEGLRVAYETASVRSSSSWVLAVDDDTFVNMPHVLLLARRFRHDASLLMGHFLDHVWQPWINDTAFSGGGTLLPILPTPPHPGHPTHPPSPSLPYPRWTALLSRRFPPHRLGPLQRGDATAGGTCRERCPPPRLGEGAGHQARSLAPLLGQRGPSGCQRARARAGKRFQAEGSDEGLRSDGIHPHATSWPRRHRCCRQRSARPAATGVSDYAQVASCHDVSGSGETGSRDGEGGARHTVSGGLAPPKCEGRAAVPCQLSRKSVSVQ